jgi:sugar O-acyltransferase (sialic acid O-acetyltransferase NeuD family)
MKTKLLIIGGRGTALNIAEAVVDAIDNYGANLELIGFANDFANPDDLNGYAVVSKVSDVASYLKMNDVKALFALYKPGYMRERVALLKSLNISQDKFINFVHPSSYLSKSARLGFGNVVLSHCSILNSVTLGNNNIISSGVTIEHDTAVGDCNFFAASSVVGASVTIGNGIFFGLNASIRENIKIDDFSFLGMASVLTKNISDEKQWYGNPARPR